MPEELRSEAGREAAWPGWVRRHDQAIRERLHGGDRESVVNLLLFGTTFTSRPRATERDLARLAGQLTRTELIDGRIKDLVAGMLAPGTNARLQFARAVLERGGIVFTSPQGAAEAARYLEDSLRRTAAEISGIDRSVRSAQASAEPPAELIERSTLFRQRGLASDTSIFSSFAIEVALNGIAATEVLGRGTVRRVAIVGPGLDFVDKRDGYDFYPQQTLQPFAVIDSLVRFGLARLDDLQVTTFDINPRINEHLLAARARTGEHYRLFLPRDRELPWSAGLSGYWDRFGDHVGERGKGVEAPSSAGPVEVRTVSVPPRVVSSILPRELNVVLQRIEPDARNEAFDLIVATDVLIYYDVFEQSLALANIAHMLRPGGVLLSNVPLVELPALPIESIGYSDAVYLTTPEIGDRVVWYRRR